jgi:probable F420-dependent oxidoreductase
VTGPLRAFRFGVNSTTTSAQEWLDVARKAEALGYSTLIAQDHFGNQFAPLPALVAAGAVTSVLRLAAMVLDNDFRHPAAVAKEAATIDVLTNGRMELGLGAGWLQSDYDKTGVAYDAPGVRMERLAESVQICKALFCSDQPVSFMGKHYRVKDLDTSPRPIQKPRPPIMIGGRQRRMLSLAAREADIVGISLLDRRTPGLPEPPSFAQKVEWVRQAAGDRLSELEIHVNASVVDVTGTPVATIEQAAARTGQTASQVRESPGTLVGSVDAVLEQLYARREQYGVTYYVIHGRVMDAFAPVLARLR